MRENTFHSRGWNDCKSSGPGSVVCLNLLPTGLSVESPSLLPIKKASIESSTKQDPHSRSVDNGKRTSALRSREATQLLIAF